MPATEETYRRQSTLHLVFAISSIAMLLSTVWMVMADHMRPWKEVQRSFNRSSVTSSRPEKREARGAKAEVQTQIDEIDAKIKAAEASADERPAQIRTIEASSRSSTDDRAPRHERRSRRPSSTASEASTTA